MNANSLSLENWEPLASDYPLDTWSLTSDLANLGVSPDNSDLLSDDFSDLSNFDALDSLGSPSSLWDMPETLSSEDWCNSSISPNNQYTPDFDSANTSSNFEQVPTLLEMRPSSKQAIASEPIAANPINTDIPHLESNTSLLEQNISSQPDTNDHPIKKPVLFYLGIAMSFCGIALVFGAKILSKVALINPGKALIIAGVSGIMLSGIGCFLGALLHRAKA